MEDTDAPALAFELIDEVVRLCPTCYNLQRPPKRNVSAPPRVRAPNKLIVMDLMYPKSGQTVLNIMDAFDKIAVSVVIPNKAARTIIRMITERWLPYWGKPAMMFYDSGKEFDNATMRSFCDKLKIDMGVAPVQAHWAMGLIERLNFEIEEAVARLLEDAKDDPYLKTAPKDSFFPMAALGHNCTPDSQGLSPFQRRLGRNPELPGFWGEAEFRELDPPREDAEDYEHFRLVLHIQAARVHTVKAQASERFRRALIARVRPGIPYLLRNGEDCTYWWDAPQKVKRGWRGGARVIGMDTDMVVLRHGGAIMRCAPRFVKPLWAAARELGRLTDRGAMPNDQADDDEPGDGADGPLFLPQLPPPKLPGSGQELAEDIDGNRGVTLTALEPTSSRTPPSCPRASPGWIPLLLRRRWPPMTRWRAWTGRSVVAGFDNFGTASPDDKLFRLRSGMRNCR